MVNRDRDVAFRPGETPPSRPVREAGQPPGGEEVSGRYAGNPVVGQTCSVYCVDVAV